MTTYNQTNRPVRIFAIDTETTGLQKPHAFSVAVLELNFNEENADERLEIAGVYNLWFDPEKEIEKEASTINGFTDEMVQQMVKEKNLSSIYDFDFVEHFNIKPTDDVYFVGQNVGYDIKCLMNTSPASTKIWLEKHLSKRIDSKDICKNHLSQSDIESYSLISLYTVLKNDLLDEDLQLKVDEDEVLQMMAKTALDAHEALNDALRSVDVINIMAKRLDIKTLDELYVNSLRFNRDEYSQLVETPKDTICKFVDVAWQIEDGAICTIITPTIETPLHLPSVDMLIKHGFMQFDFDTKIDKVTNADELKREFDITLDELSFDELVAKLETVYADSDVHTYVDRLTIHIIDLEIALNDGYKEIYTNACIDFYNQCNYS